MGDYYNEFADEAMTLSHHGILGQKWGVRRYQNSDGSLTEAGKRRYSQGKDNRIKFDEGTGKIEKGQERKAIGRAHKEASNDYSNLGTVQNQAANIARSGSQLANKSAKREQEKAMAKMDLSDMTDKDLQAAVNRMNLERNYKLLATADVGAGKRYAGDILDTAGTVLAMGASAALIAASIHQIMS